VSAIVLTGAGRGFCSGADLSGEEAYAFGMLNALVPEGVPPG